MARDDEGGYPLGPGYPSDVEGWPAGAQQRAPGALQASRTLGVPPERLTGQQLTDVTVSMKPPEEIQYPQSFGLYVQGQAVIPTGTSATVASFAIPSGMVGVVRSAIFYGQAMTIGVLADWSVLVNTSEVQGWRRRVPPQNAATAFLSYGPDETLIRIPDGGELALRISVTAGGPVTLGGQLAGWFYPATLADRFRLAWGG